MSRHRRLKKISHAEAAESITNLTAMREQLAKDYNMSADDPRIAQACIVRLNQGAWEKQILVGVPVPAVELEAYTNVVAALLGPPPCASLKVRFVHVCFHCQTESEIDPDALCAKCGAELPPKPERGPVELMHASEPPLVRMHRKPHQLQHR
jgi:hypothetical protein